MKELIPILALLASAPFARGVTNDCIVADDGSGTHRTLQAAIAAAPSRSPEPFTILVRPGTYEGQIIVPQEKQNLRIVGRQPDTTILTYGLNVYETNRMADLRFKGTGVIVLADGFRAENITFRNTSGDHGQAMALRVDGDRAAFSNCRMLGWQDTLMVNNGYHYFTNCTIEGRVDFIYGSATALFDHCRIHSKNGGFVTAASTPAERPFGFVFLDCKLTGDPTPWASNPAAPDPKPMTYLGRPWRPHASVAFIRCELGDHIRPEGWENWRNEANEKTARYAEYRSTGPGANPPARVKWSRQLSDEEAAAYTIPNILGDSHR